MSTEPKEWEIDAREGREGKMLCMFLSFHTDIKACFLVSESMLQPFIFPAREVDYQHTAAALRRAKQNELEIWQSVFLLFSTTGYIKRTEEGDTTKQVLNYSNSVQLHCSQWSYTDLHQ